MPARVSPPGRTPQSLRLAIKSSEVKNLKNYKNIEFLFFKRTTDPLDAAGYTWTRDSSRNVALPHGRAIAAFLRGIQRRRFRRTSEFNYSAYVFCGSWSHHRQSLRETALALSLVTQCESGAAGLARRTCTGQFSSGRTLV